VARSKTVSRGDLSRDLLSVYPTYREFVPDSRDPFTYNFELRCSVTPRPLRDCEITHHESSYGPTAIR